MPCSGCGDDYYENDSKIEDNNTLAKYKQEIDKLTQMLCYVCGDILTFIKINNSFNSFENNKKLSDWWLKHSGIDRDRLSNEMYQYMLSNIDNPAVFGYKDRCIQKFINKATSVHPVSTWHRTVFFQQCYEIALAKYNNLNIEAIKSKLTPNELSWLIQDIKLNKNII